MGRIEDKFRLLKKQGKKAFIAYVPFGFPTVKQSRDIIMALDRAGVDFIELGLPFSDPLADGPIIQQASYQALCQGANQDILFKTLKEIKGSLTAPVIIMTYYNPVYAYGLDRFIRESGNSGIIGGTIIVDLPVEETGEYLEKSRKRGLDTILFITPTTSRLREKNILSRASGFVYYVSVTGVTGPRDIPAAPVHRHIKRLKSVRDVPVCVGFGIHTREQVRNFSKAGDGVIVGSAVVKFIQRHCREKGFLPGLEKYVRGLYV